jgi:lysophospholipase L1-like esterase
VVAALLLVALHLVVQGGHPQQPATTGASGAGLRAAPAAADREVARTHPRGLRVVALGDSVTSGAACGCDAFPALYGRLLAQRTGVPVHVENDGVNGLDSAGLRAGLGDTTSPVAGSVAAADVVLVTIGANDFSDHHDEVVERRCLAAVDCVADEMAQLRTDIDDILVRTRALRGGRPTAVLVTGYWNVFQDGDVARALFHDEGLAAAVQLTRRTNTVIESAATANGATYVDLFGAFRRQRTGMTGLLAGDGDHPSASGHQLIARVLMAAGLPGLSDR